MIGQNCYYFSAGFGDIIPEHPEFMICNPLVVIGLTLVSIIVHLIQDKLDLTLKKPSGTTY